MMVLLGHLGYCVLSLLPQGVFCLCVCECVSVCECVGVLLVVMIVSLLTWIIFADIKSYRRRYEVRLGTL